MHDRMFAVITGECLSKLGGRSQQRKTVGANSICVSCIGTAGLVCITDRESQTNQQINTIALEIIERREFVYFTATGLNELINQYGATGATMVNLSKSKFEALPVVRPPEPLISSFHDSTAPMLDEIRILLHSNQHLRKTRDLLLPKLISGKLDVEELDIAVE